jgi:Tol biopolymer transport system component
MNKVGLKLTSKRLLAVGVVLAATAAAGTGGLAQGASQEPSGKLAFARLGDIWIANANGSNATQLTTDPGNDRSPSWSPDGQQIAFASDRDGDSEIFVMNADGSNQHQLTFNTPSNDRSPSWTATATQIVYDKDFNELYVINVDGSGGEGLLRHNAFSPATAPNGEKLAFSDQAIGGVFTMNLDGSGLKPVASPGDGETLDADWSPTGNNIAFVGAGGPTDFNDLYTVHANGSRLLRMTTADQTEFSPVWAPDGTRIAFVGCFDILTVPNCDIYMMNPNGSDVKQITTFGMAQGPAKAGALDWQPIPPH